MGLEIGWKKWIFLDKCFCIIFFYSIMGSFYSFIIYLEEIMLYDRYVGYVLVVI